LELFTASVILSLKNFSIPKLNKTRENIAIKKDGIKVNNEKRVIYFKLVFEPDLLFFPAE